MASCATKRKYDELNLSTEFIINRIYFNSESKEFYFPAKVYYIDENKGISSVCLSLFMQKKLDL